MVIAAIAALVMFSPSTSLAQTSTDPQPGQLWITQDGKPTDALCALERTDVRANISGFGARVTVVQTFRNPTDESIEAIYTFPLPHEAAVDQMRMRIGDRTIEGSIKRREEARRIYEAAKSAGQAASLLDQERPNIFTQSVANIPPKSRIEVEIGYVQVLEYKNDEFEFNFPMVVGPRYLGNAPDPTKIAPPIIAKGKRTGSNISLTVSLDAGARIQDVESVLHQVSIRGEGPSRATITLAKRDEIPNRDFILKYRVATDDVRSALITHMDDRGRGGFFSLILLPPQQPKTDQISPREIIFVMDQSGSQQGFPIEKSKELTLGLMKTLRSVDTFNVIGFNTSSAALWDRPRPVTESNLKQATSFVNSLQAGGGTNVREGVVAALGGRPDPNRLRIVLFNTDGYVGDEKLILDTIQKRRGSARMYTFGIGDSVNRWLIDMMSVEGGGDSEIVTLATDASKAAGRFIERLKTPVLTDVDVDFEGINVEEAHPKFIADVFDNKPIVIFGRYEGPGKGRVKLAGKVGGKPWARSMDAEFRASNDAPAVMSLWARKKVDSLYRENWMGTWNEESPNRRTEAIIDTALEFGIMTEHTSFVAVEPRIINVGGKQRTVRVPVEMANGVSYEGAVGAGEDPTLTAPQARMTRGNQSMAKRALGGASAGYGGAAPGTLGGSTIMRGADFDRSSATAPDKIAKKLKGAKGQVAVQIWLAKLDAKTSDALKEAGLKVDVSDSKLKIVFGTCDASALKKLSELTFVQRIEPIE